MTCPLRVHPLANLRGWGVRREESKSLDQVGLLNRKRKGVNSKLQELAPWPERCIGPTSFWQSYEEMERNENVKLYYHRISRNGMPTLHISPDNTTQYIEGY